MESTSAQLTVTRARHIVRRAARVGGHALRIETNRAIKLLVNGGADLNGAIHFVFAVRRSSQAI